jgi:hypothetical protein
MSHSFSRFVLMLFLKLIQCSRDVWSLGILLASWCLGSVPIHGAEASTILLTIFKLIGRPPREDVLYLGDMHDRLIAALPSALLSLPLAGQSPPTSPERAVSPSSLLSANQTNSTTPTLLSWLAALSQPAALIELVAACLQYAPIKRPLPSDLLHLYSFAALDSVHHAACHSDVDSMALKDVVSSTELVDLPDLAWRADAATQLQTSLNIPSETVLRSAQKAKPATVPAVRSNAIPRFVDSSDLPTESAVRVTSARVMPSVAAAVSLFSAPLVTMSESLSMDKLRSASDQLNKLNVSMDHQVQPTDSAAISQRFAVDLVPPAAVNSESGDPEMKPVVLPSSLLRSFTELSDYASPTLATANLDLRTMYPHLFDKDSLISEVMKKEAASLKEHVSVLKTDLQTMISQVETMRLGSDVAPANICDQGAFRQHSVEEQMQALRESTRLISNVGYDIIVLKTYFCAFVSIIFLDVSSANHHRQNLQLPSVRVPKHPKSRLSPRRNCLCGRSTSRHRSRKSIRSPTSNRQLSSSRQPKCAKDIVVSMMEVVVQRRVVLDGVLASNIRMPLNHRWIKWNWHHFLRRSSHLATRLENSYLPE